MSIMSIISSIILGLIVGALARSMLPGEQKMGWVMTAVLGIAGSVLASVVGQAMGWYKPGEVAGWMASVGAAIVLLFVFSKLQGGKSS
jgi:uncharacterized membrane protein YeaQ/YmgE (transglycosylase-associated protein family)